MASPATFTLGRNPAPLVTFPVPTASNAACGFPALRSPAWPPVNAARGEGAPLATGAGVSGRAPPVNDEETHDEVARRNDRCGHGAGERPDEFAGRDELTEEEAAVVAQQSNAEALARDEPPPPSLLGFRLHRSDRSFSTSFVSWGSAEDVRLVERFTRVDAETVQ